MKLNNLSRSLVAKLIFACLVVSASAEPLPFPASLLSSAPFEGAVSVSKAKSAVQPGRKILVRGRVGGTSKPLAENIAIFVLADEQTIKACSDIPGDSCPTPWDYCCEPTEKLRDSTATVQVKDGSGNVIRAGLRELGLKELSTVVVSGTVDPASGQGILIINAERIHVMMGSDPGKLSTAVENGSQ